LGLRLEAAALLRQNIMKSRDSLLAALPVFAFVASLGAANLGCSADNVAGGGGSAGTAGSTAGASGSPTAGAGGSTAGSAGSGGSAGSSAGAPSGGGGAGGAGGGGGGGGAGGGGGMAVEASFNTLKSIIQMSCFGGLCHDLPEHPLQLKVDDKLYTTLTTHMTDGCGILVKPGSPQESALIKLLKGPCGDIERMPSGKCFVDGDEGCVSPEKIAALEEWITQGAMP
jgi:hypothetical protein